MINNTISLLIEIYIHDFVTNKGFFLRGHQHGTSGTREFMDVEAEEAAARNPEAETEEQIEADAQAEMHDLREMVSFFKLQSLLASTDMFNNLYVHFKLDSMTCNSPIFCQLNNVGRKDFLEGLFTLLKALNSLIGYMKVRTNVENYSEY